MHLSTAVFPQTADSDVIEFSVKHEVQQEGKAEDDETAPQAVLDGIGADEETGDTGELLEPDGYTDDETGATGELLELGYGTALHVDEDSGAGGALLETGETGELLGAAGTLLLGAPQ